MKEKLLVLRKTYQNWMNNEPFQHSAVVAYYTLFSLPSLLLIITWIAGYFFKRSNVEQKLIAQISDITGPETADSIQSMIGSAVIEEGNFMTLIISIGVLVFGATGAFFQLKKAMNNIWSVRPKNDNIKGIILDRIISLGMIFVIGFLMLISLVVSTLISYLSDYISVYAPKITSYGVGVLNFILSYIFIGFLFASIIRLLPDIKIKWKTTFIGASLTTLLFLIGKYLLGFYFSESDPASAYGGASSVVLILLWVYYSCLILFFGAEFTVQYALYKNEDIVPSNLAEPAYYQELEELEEKRREIERNKKDLDKLSEPRD
ncbi:YihY/virulence factor BrkB family protein [Mesonia sp. MT50]|uniref:YihY/virulence factor BrkB family protein n=1 Tax=Mesonia profundi TaxID=3070998 RepID=A0ABU1A4C9_9FLAO|nr:YihY/virulence factor BrkB family protein [Mesonia profundi]MDQ7918505.1 YihY/virulence factor BrkB family protein [Mesonia profundi]